MELFIGLGEILRCDVDLTAGTLGPRRPEGRVAAKTFLYVNGLDLLNHRIEKFLGLADTLSICTVHEVEQEGLDKLAKRRYL